MKTLLYILGGLAAYFLTSIYMYMSAMFAQFGG
jgi:hypothetical protein